MSFVGDAIDWTVDKVEDAAEWTGETIGKITGQDEVEEAAKDESAKMDSLAAEAKAMALEQAGNLAAADAIRQQAIAGGYDTATGALQDWSGIGDDARTRYKMGLMGSPAQFKSSAITQIGQMAQEGPGAIDPRINPELSTAFSDAAARRAMTGVNSDLAGGLDQRALAQQGLSSDVMSRAGQIPQSQYFDQAAQLSGQRPSRLQDIEGYDLMRQARDEALEASGQQFAGQGKFMSGSRLREAGDIGAQAAQQLVAQDDARRQQQVSNLMGLGAQDVSAQQRGFQNLLGAEGQQFGMGQQGFQNLQSREQADLQRQQANIANLRTGAQDYSSIRQQNLQNLMGVQGLEDARRQQQMQNLGTLAQQDLGVQQMNYGANQDLMNRQRELMGMGLGIDQSLGNLAVQQGQQLGQSGYGTAQDQANIMLGGQAQSAGLTQAGSGYNMAGAGARQQMFGDIINAGASLLGGGGVGIGGGGGGGGGINYGGGYANDNYLMG